jgi:hypothetical protein
VPVDGGIDANAIEAWIAAGKVDGGEIGERCAATRQKVALVVEKPDAQRLGHAGAAVVDAAVAAAEQDAARTEIECGTDKFADAIARRQAGIALTAGNKAEPGGGGHLDDGGRLAAPAEKTEMRLDRIVDGAGYRQMMKRAAGRLDEGFGEPLSAIGHRRLQHYGVGERPAHALFDAIGGFVRREAFLETGGGD